MRKFNSIMKFRSVAGITLIELMATVVIIGIVSGMAVPRFQKAMERLKFRSADREMTSTLRLARSLSISEKRTYGVYFNDAPASNTGQYCYVLFLDKVNPGANTFDAGDSTIRVDSLPGEISALVTDITNNIVVFQPNGSASFSGGGNIVTLATTEDLIGIQNHNILASTGRIKSVSYYY